MLTIKTLENIKLGARINIFNGVYASLVGVFYFVFFNFILKTDMRAIDVVWQVFSKYNHDLNALYVRLVILKGIFIFALGILMILE